MACVILTKLQVADRAGTLKVVENSSPLTTDITGEVELVAGGVMSATVEGNVVTLDAAIGTSTPDPDLQAFYLDKLSSGIPYLASISSVKPDATGSLHLANSICGQVGMFEDQASISAVDHTLQITDLCQPCIDCADFERVYTRLSELASWILSNHTVNFVEDTEHQQLLPPTRLYRQYQAMLFYWNFMVQSQAYVLMSKVEGSNVRIWFGYYNQNCNVEDPSFYLNVLMDRYQTMSCVRVTARVLNIDSRFQGTFTLDTPVIALPTSGTLPDYVYDTGSVETGNFGCNLLPTGIEASGGRWRIYDGAWSAWYEGVDPADPEDPNLVAKSEGIYTVEFQDIDPGTGCYNTPYKRRVRIARGGWSVETGVYTAQGMLSSSSSEEDCAVGNNELPWATISIEGDGTMDRGDYFTVEVLVEFTADSTKWAGNDCDAEISGHALNHVLVTGHWANIFDGQVVSRVKEISPEVAELP